ncbi:MAG: hypothetical protein M0Q88_00210 [Bacilli bacterium]|nr:hypothetical protein [Bacilli bacterium]
MEKIKEEIKELINKGIPVPVRVLHLIDEAQQDYTFIRVPKKVKLSGILKRLEEYLPKEYDVWYEKCLGILIENDKEDFKCIGIKENKINEIENQDVWEIKFFPKWLYQYWIAGTIIEVDV